jgi:hypothetical protein
MASQYLPSFYDDATLLALELRSRDVWNALKASDPFRDWDKDTELRIALAEKLMALADAGVTDRLELRRRSLATLSLGRVCG